MSCLLVASGSPRERLWSRISAERQGHLPVVDVPPTAAGMTAQELEIRAEDFAADDELPAVLAKLESETRRDVLIVPAEFYADGDTIRALRQQTQPFEERMTLHWRPGPGGR